MEDLMHRLSDIRLLLTAVFIFVGVGYSQNLKAVYRFGGSLNSSVAGALAAANLPLSNANSFEADTVDGQTRQTGPTPTPTATGTPCPAAGSLDTTFDGDGRVTTPIGLEFDEGRSVAIQTDGRLVAAGYSSNGTNNDFAVVRYNTNGTLDTSFSDDGKALTPIFAASDDYAFSVAVQSDGRIVVAGFTVNASNADLAVVRYNTDGSLDTSFDGDGKAITPVGSSADIGYSVAIQPDGRIVVVGTSRNGAVSDFAIIRYNTNGSLDTSFDGDGKVMTSIRGEDNARSVAIQTDGRIVVAGNSFEGSDTDFTLVRYNANGTLDTSFDGDGMVITPVGGVVSVAYSVAVQTDGRIVAAGCTVCISEPDDDFAVVRYNTDGTLDTSFDGDGKVVTQVGSGSDQAFSIATQTDGRLVVAGFSSNGSNADFGVVRYNTDGSLDNSFDGDGKALTPIGSGSDDAASVAIQSDGRIVAAGTSSNDFALVRYLGQASCPTTPTNTPTATPTNTPTTTTLGNYPAAAISLSSNTTVVPNAPPSNTTTINVSTNTNFKGHLEADSVTGVVRVTDAHPAGTYLVTVKAFGPAATAISTFSLTVGSGTSCLAIQFAAPANFGVGFTPHSVAVGDFNRDGKQDIATANKGSLGSGGNVSIRLGDGLGSFGPAVNFSVGLFEPEAMAVGDFNGDGKQDIATANSSGDNISILIGSGTGSFGAASIFGAGTSPNAIAVGDFNGDGRQDLAVVNNSFVSILLGNGLGSFAPRVNFLVGFGPSSVAVGDFNGDGKQDIAVTNSSSQSNSVSILLGTGTGSFGSAVNFGVGSGASDVAVGDFNGDSKQDIGVVNAFSNNVSILLGNGAGSFAAATNFATGLQPVSIVIGDFNGDSKQDIAAANQQGDSLSVLIGNGLGGFAAANYLPLASAPYAIALGDFNGDGLQDLAATRDEVSANAVSILLRTCTVSTPTNTPTSTPTATNTPTNTATATPTSTSSPSGNRAEFDYDGDRKTDISVFRPSSGAWYLLQSHAGLFGAQFGFGTDKITPADFDGDGKSDLAVYRPSDGIWYVLRSSDGTVSYYVFGLADDLPTPADYDGDGKADVSVFRPSDGNWYRQNSGNGTFVGIHFGASEDKPTVGDFDGDGRSDIAVFRPSTGAWYQLYSTDASIHGENFGFGTDILVPADYDGDGKMDVAVFRTSDGYWYARNSSDGAFTYKIFGLATDIPAPGDFDGDGHADINVFRPSDGTWYRQNSSNGAFIATPFGTNGDKPTLTAYRY
jgi:uncharacterized delta-60 repeat protein